MSMTDEELSIHRELQLLRAAGIAGSHRRRGKRRRIKPVNKDARELAGWVDTRHDKLDAIR
mgnify:CR=1 FL=1